MGISCYVNIIFESSLEGVFLHNTNIQIILWNFSLRNTTLLRNLSRNLKLFFFRFLCWNLRNALLNRDVHRWKKPRTFLFYTTEKYEQANPLLSWIYFSVNSHDILVSSNAGGTYSFKLLEAVFDVSDCTRNSILFSDEKKIFLILLFAYIICLPPITRMRAEQILWK